MVLQLVLLRSPSAKKGVYDKDYFSAHRSLKNLNSRGVELESLALESLSSEEKIYLVGGEVFPFFKSPMKYYHLGQDFIGGSLVGSKNAGVYTVLVGGKENEETIQINNPECYVRLLHNNTLRHEVGKELALSFESPDIYLAYIQNNLPSTLEEFREYVDCYNRFSSREYGQLLSLFDLYYFMSKKLDKIAEDTSELQSNLKAIFWRLNGSS